MSHFLSLEHFFAPSHLPDWHFAASASDPFVHPVKATSAKPTREEKITFFIVVSSLFFLELYSLRYLCVRYVYCTWNTQMQTMMMKIE